VSGHDGKKERDMKIAGCGGEKKGDVSVMCTRAGPKKGEKVGKKGEEN